jgi:stage III sporulation protein AH
MKKFFSKIKMPRINVIIGKKQIIIAGLALLLGLAVWVNFAVSANRNNSAIEEPADRSASYGDAQFVSGGNVVDDDVAAFFAQARISKRESRDEAKEFIQTIIAGGDVRLDEIQAIAADAAVLGEFIEAEARVEAVLRAQGFSDVLCYISDRGTNIIVRTDGLTPQCAAKIRDALLSEVNVPVENITIVEIK